MANKRFEKGSEEWEFFQEFWKFVQDNFIPENNQKYWDDLTETASNIDAKYSTKLSYYMINSYLEYLDDKSKEVNHETSATDKTT